MPIVKQLPFSSESPRIVDCATAMESSEVGKKRKRAWRKPREAIGPGVLETSTKTRPSLTRIIRKEGEKTAAASLGVEPMDTSSATPGKQVSTAGCIADSGNGGGRGLAQQGGGEEQVRGGSSGEQKAAAVISSPPSTSETAVVEIDGSVLEGVRYWF